MHKVDVLPSIPPFIKLKQMKMGDYGIIQNGGIYKGRVIQKINRNLVITIGGEMGDYWQDPDLEEIIDWDIEPLPPKSEIKITLK